MPIDCNALPSLDPAVVSRRVALQDRYMGQLTRLKKRLQAATTAAACDPLIAQLDALIATQHFPIIDAILKDDAPQPLRAQALTRRAELCAAMASPADPPGHKGEPTQPLPPACWAPGKVAQGGALPLPPIFSADEFGQLCDNSELLRQLPGVATAAAEQPTPEQSSGRLQLRLLAFGFDPAPATPRCLARDVPCPPQGLRLPQPLADAVAAVDARLILQRLGARCVADGGDLWRGPAAMQGSPFELLPQGGIRLYRSARAAGALGGAGIFIDRLHWGARPEEKTVAVGSAYPNRNSQRTKMAKMFVFEQTRPASPFEPRCASFRATVSDASLRMMTRARLLALGFGADAPASTPTLQVLRAPKLAGALALLDAHDRLIDIWLRQHLFPAELSLVQGTALGPRGIRLVLSDGASRLCEIGATDGSPHRCGVAQLILSAATEAAA